MSVEQGQSVPLEEHGPGCCRDEQQPAWQAPQQAHDPQPSDRAPQHCLPCAE